MHNNKKGFTLVELLAVIVILAVVILIAVTAVIPRMNKAKKNAFIYEALVYLKAAKESLVFGEEENLACINISDLNDEYVKKNGDSYSGIIRVTYLNNDPVLTINLTNGKYYLVSNDNPSIQDVSDSAPTGFASSCGNYNPVIDPSSNTNTLAYTLLMNEGASTLKANLDLINNRTATVDFSNIETDASKSGLYRGEDNDGASYYYRGVVNNNWVEFGNFYWRIIRINGDGSVRLIYSGTKSSSHTGTDAAIKLDRYSYATGYTEQTNDITGLTNNKISTSYNNGKFGNGYIGYMYNREKEIYTYPDKDVTTTVKLDKFPTYNSINETKNDYVFFKNFNIATDCHLGSGNDESGTCTLKCRSLGTDCIIGNWNTIATTSGNYATSGGGYYSNSSGSTVFYPFISDYKYSCWANGTPVTKENSDGTTSVYMSCPVVSEIIGTVKNKPTQAKVKYHGLAPSSEKTAYSNMVDSKIKVEVDNWYMNQILNKKDSSNTHNLEDYIADEVFCNDRSSQTNGFPIDNNGGSYYFGFYTRGYTQKIPSFKCPNMRRDGFTLGGLSESTVTPKNSGNGMQKYPIGLITGDEALAAGSKYATANESYYLYTGVVYLTMTPWIFNSGNSTANIIVVQSNGYVGSYNTTTSAYIRPVINLSKDVLYSSGSGTEADPYKVTLE